VNKKLSCLAVLVLLLIAPRSGFAQSDTPAGAAASEQTHRVLFLGNSYTYYNSMPRLFKAMVEARLPGHQVEAEFLGGGGATLKVHWEVELALAEIRSGEWDYVVLQEQSMLGASDLTDPDSPNQFYEYARRFDAEISKSGAETVFYMTWAGKDQKEQQPYLTHAYLAIAEELGSRVAPVGMAWEGIRENPDIGLFIDGSHPSVVGSYMAAMTLAATIFEIAPKDTPGELFGHEILRGGAISEDEIRLSDLSDDEVQAVQAAVARSLEMLKTRTLKVSY
jgi:hypothetical protein